MNEKPTLLCHDCPHRTKSEGGEVVDGHVAELFFQCNKNKWRGETGHTCHHAIDKPCGGSVRRLDLMAAGYWPFDPVRMVTVHVGHGLQKTLDAIR